jgi:hypothetical protein
MLFGVHSNLCCCSQYIIPDTLWLNNEEHLPILGRNLGELNVGCTDCYLLSMNGKGHPESSATHTALIIRATLVNNIEQLHLWKGIIQPKCCTLTMQKSCTIQIILYPSQVPGNIYGNIQIFNIHLYYEYETWISCSAPCR